MARLNQHWLTAVLLTLVMSCSGSGGKTPLTDVETTEMDSEVEVDQTQAVCGNGIPEAGEECDNGTANSDDQPDACRTDCTLASCGDGVQDSGEACDDGAANSDAIADACRSSCSLPECGDGVTDTGEQCDDGALNSDSVADACRTSCIAPSCGDGVTDSGEQCDAGELNSDTQANACRTSCMSAGCGDGVIDSAEVCDGENLGSATCANIDQGFSGGTLACAATCDAFDTALCEGTPLTCGNGRIDDGEDCDNGEENSDELADACRTNCTNPGCGDGVVDTGEGCDTGLENSDSEPDACRTTCQPASCGDTVIDTGESCDDGGDNSDTKADACRTSCQEAGCGDGVVDSGEGCDNGTANSDTEADACRLSCQEAGCGDGVVDSAEDCEGDVGTATCESLGYTSGNLSCDTLTCLYDVSDCSATLFFSEYVEGSSNNKALEIYNPSASDVPLTGCSVMLYSNGGTSISQQLDLSGTISGHGTYVICNGSSGPELAPRCDTQHSVTNFNGDDTLTLECNAQLLDVIGQLGFDPGSAWGTAPATTVNQTLRRKCSVNAGDPDASDEFVPADEWLGLPIDTFADLGHHCNLGPVVDCRLQWPLSIDFDSASVDESVFGRLSLPGLTDLDANAPTDFADPHPQLLVSMVFGLESDPTETWTAVAASPNAGYNTASPGYEAGWDEYTALLLNAGLANGSYRYAYAVSADSGETWRLCDSTGGDFALTDAGVLNVGSVDPCAGVVCDTPPANDCSGDNAQVYESTGTCTAGVCSYAVASTIDCSTSGGCVAGTCADLCGNTVLDPTEVCDADLLGGETCLSQGFLSGTLACSPGCAAFDTTGCVPADGNLGSAIGAAVATGSNVGAGDDFEAGCQSNNGADLGLLWTPPADGCYVIDMAGSTYDTVLHVQTLPDGTEVACNDDAVGLGTRSRVTLTAAMASQQYLLILDAYGSATGDYVLNIQPCPEPVEVITGCPVEFCTETVDGDETTYTYTIPVDVHPVVDDAEGACFEGTPGRDLIVIVDTTGINAISASTCTGSTSADASLAIFDGDPTAAGVELACNEDNGAQACAALTNIQVTGSSTYVLVDEYGTGYWTNTTARSFSIVVSSAPYDPCGNALIDTGEACDGSNYNGESCMSLGYAGGPLSCETDCSALIETACIALDGDLGSAVGDDVSTGTTVGAGADFSGTCGGTSAPDLAFLWTPPTDGCYRIDTVGSSYDTVLYVRDYLAGTQLECNNDGAGISPQSMVQIDAAMAGQGYLIVVDGASTNEGDYVLNINPCPEGVEVITGCPVEYCTETPGGGPHGGDLYTYVLAGVDHPIIDDFPTAGCSSFGNGRDLLLVLDMAGYAGFSASTCAADPGDSSLAAFDVDPTGGGAVAVACNGDATGESSSFCSKLADGTGTGTPPSVVSFVEPMLYIQVDEYGTTYWNGIAQRTIQVELIPDDPCFGVTCDAPPADFCTGTVATQYAAPGTCNPGTGVCEYTSSTVDCATTSQECVAGACVNECGNSALDTGEVCDGTLLNGETCTTQGFAGGTLGCATDCGAYDTSPCIAIDDDLGTAVGDAVSTGTTVGAGNDFSGSCGGGSAADLAFLWSPPSDGCYIISTTGSDFDTVLYVREQPAATQLACRDLMGTESVTLSTAEAAESYLIFVDGFSTNEGDYELNINPCPVGVEVITGCPVEYCTESVGAGPNGGTLLTYVLAGADQPRIDYVPADSCSGFGNGRDLLIVLDMAGYAGFSASTCAANPGDSSSAAYA
ncbi:MAG: hypothetical protein RBU37_09840, partial [Myxococcota bacterium]|nr:hypothetical protein [Myxococcota bacterium]